VKTKQTSAPMKNAAAESTWGNESAGEWQGPVSGQIPKVALFLRLKSMNSWIYSWEK